MSVAPDPSEIFARANREGERRLNQSLLEMTSNAFLAGLTIVFGIVAMAITQGVLEPRVGDAAKIGGALAFGIGVVFLVVGRTELFSENFFDPVATAFEERNAVVLRRLIRLWTITLGLNLVGGAVFSLIMAVEGVLPHEAADAIGKLAESIVERSGWAGFANAVVGGALLSIMSFSLAAVNSVGSRMLVAYIGGFLLALGPFDHVVVTTLHLLLGILFGSAVAWIDVGVAFGISTAGNLAGGLGLVTFIHIAQAKGAAQSKH